MSVYGIAYIGAIVLDDLYISSQINLRTEFIGMDSIDYCNDKKWFGLYPHQVSYRFNSRGFRGEEWAGSDIWCLGDSFTMGLGSPESHTWCSQLKGTNVSMSGASNDWLARRALDIIEQVRPARLVIMWSFIERRELDVDTVAQKVWREFYQVIRDTQWPHDANFVDLPQKIQQEIAQKHHDPRIHINGNDISIKIDDDARIHQDYQASDQENIQNFADNIQKVALAMPTAIHAFVPGFCRKDLETQCRAVMPDRCLAITPKLDLARDGYHFDIKTSRWIAQEVQNLW